MTPEVFDIYNKHLINLVNVMFEEFDIKDFLTAQARERLVRDGRLVSRHNKIDLADICKFLMQPRTETMNVESRVFLELINKQTDVTKEDIMNDVRISIRRHSGTSTSSFPPKSIQGVSPASMRTDS